MVAVFESMVFAAAFAAVIGVFAFTLFPALPRIAALLRGEADPKHRIRPALILSDRQVRARIRPVAMRAVAARPQSRPLPYRAAA
jgi:hypothetical protein